MNPDLLELLASWQLHLTSMHRAKGTVDTYSRGVKSYVNWCGKAGLPVVIDRTTVQLWISEMLENGAEPATAKTRLWPLKAFSKWLASEGEIETDTLAGMPLPKLDTKVIPALTDTEINAIIRACNGPKFVDRRDEAIIRFMLETTARASEVTGMDTGDVNLANQTAVIRRGKGGKGRVVPFSSQCAAAIDRYLRMRRRLGVPEDGPLWMGARGRTFGYYALRLTLVNRARAAGVDNFHLHLTRHTAATRWLRQGGSEAGLMAVAGWSDRAMLDRYTSASATERAIEEAKRLDLGEF